MEDAMIWKQVLVPLVIGALAIHPGAQAMSFPPSAPRDASGVDIQLDGKVNCPYMSAKGGLAYLQVSVRAGDLEVHDRRLMNVAVVIDRSGSMGGEGKIENARKALERLVDQLRTDDILSLVMYDDVVEVLRPACRVRSKDEIRRLIEEVYPRGWTNLGGGLMEGFRQVERNACGSYNNRVILLSDGLANRGVTDPCELDRMAARYRARSISLTTMGVGLAYNENLMVGLANNGGGNYYFIERAGDLAGIFRQEFNALSALVVQNATLELTLGNGVRLIDAIGCERRESAQTQSIALGDLCANETREVTVELDVPGGTGTRTVASGRLSYDTESGHRYSVNSFTAVVHYVTDVAEVDRHRDMEAQGKADIALSTRAVDRSMRALDEGRRDEAVAQLAAARATIAASPAAIQGGSVGAMVKDQNARLTSYMDQIEDKSADVKKVKKAVQYENYKQQKKKE
jgi:Ca-activated chloride channel family protein